MLVLSGLFQTFFFFFAILCSVIRKVLSQLSMPPAGEGGSASSPLLERPSCRSRTGPSVVKTKEPTARFHLHSETPHWRSQEVAGAVLDFL